MTIPASVTSIEWYAFYKCTSRACVGIPDSVANIGCKAFEDCTSRTNVHYKGTKDDWDKIEGISSSGLSSKTIICTDGTIEK